MGKYIWQKRKKDKLNSLKLIFVNKKFKTVLVKISSTVNEGAIENDLRKILIEDSIFINNDFSFMYLSVIVSNEILK